MFWSSSRIRRVVMVAALTLVAMVPDAAWAGCSLVDGKPRFELSGNEARDRTSGLVWRRCPLGTTWIEGRCDGRERHLSLDDAEAAMRAEAGGWRLPDVKELYDLLDDGCGAKPVDTTVFPMVGDNDAELDGFWTTTPVGIGELWYFVDLSTGRADGHSRGFSMAVLPVRKAH